MDEWELEQEQDRRQTETFRRLHQLVKRGYTVDWTYGAEVEDAFWLTHPGGEPRLILYPSGMVVAVNDSAILNAKNEYDRDRIFNTELSEVHDFDRWLATVRPPNWREKTASDREKYVWQPGCLIVAILICFIIGKALEWGWHAVFD